jgi:anaerobic magnesium-protoporphyrin IX monomethyl ester cyclase
MPKIIFIEPKAPNLHIFSKFQLPRLGSFILGTMMKNRGWEVEIIVEQTQNIQFQKITGADLVGISTITPTAPRAYAIADRIRDMEIPVIMGGPHVTYLVEEGLGHADYIIRGEGERALMALIDAWEGKRCFSEVPNLAYRTDGKITLNPMQPSLENLDTIPFPDFSLLKNKLLHIGLRKTIPVQTSRGCPFNCSFCSVTGMFGKKYRFRSTENIIRELRQYNHPRNDIFFYDDNFTANRNRAKELLRKMIEEGFTFRWSTQVRVDIAKDLELVRLMKKAGCHTLYIGFESINPESLKEMHKAQTVDDMMQAIKTLHKYRINIHGMFVYGFDEDNWKTVQKTVKFAKKAKLSSTQFLILTPLPGSELYNRLNTENRIQFQDWNLYDAHHVVFRPKCFSFFDLQKAQIFSHKKFYSIKESFKKIWTWKWLEIGIAHYARHLNRSWKKQNKTYLRVVDLLTPSKKAHISIQYKENVIL